MRRERSNQVALMIVVAIALFIALRGAQGEARYALQAGGEAIDAAASMRGDIGQLQRDVDYLHSDLSEAQARVETICMREGC